MSTVRKKSSAKSRRAPRAVGKRATKAAASSSAPAARRRSSEEAEATLRAIRAGQVDALVIQGDDSEKLYALKTFAEIAQTEAALETAGIERSRSLAQLRALAEERELLFQDMHDGCIQSIYAVGLNLEACMRVVEANPKKAMEMIAHATASLSLVIQELRSFITGRRLQIAAGQDLRTEIEKAVQAASYRGPAFTVDIDESAMKALSPEQSLHLLQIAREGISNATRHANARTAHVSLRKRRGAVCLEVIDDGSGFVVKKVNKLGLGLHHIEARARKLGGRARVSSAPNKGTRIVVELGKTR
jgi:signal transduction histidine kinase